NLRLAAVSVKKDEFGEALKYLKEVGMQSDLTRDEELERVELAAKVAQARGHELAAVKYLKSLTDNWRGEPEKIGKPLLNLARLLNQLNDNKSALIALDRIRVLQEDTKKISSDVHADSLQMMANILLEDGQTDKGIEVANQLLDNYEKDRPLQSMRYKIGKVEFDRGNLVAAEKYWGQLGKESVWNSIATEQLEHAKFKDNYKKYIERIPAMAGLREGVKE
ncbi:MAG: hypothetical protein KDD25_06095, partial [Bdellovibrionales bacterium]|nr:hypothetical protein [Bdellovibrionales bacterium]